MRPLCAEGRAGVDRKGDAVFGSGMAVDDQRREHDGIAQQNRKQALPPVHAGIYHTRRQHVGGNAHTHTHPQRSDVPKSPRALAASYGRQVFIEQEAGWEWFFEFDDVAGSIHAFSVSPSLLKETLREVSSASDNRSAIVSTMVAIAG